MVNETAVTLEWSPPRESGGRGDVTYSVHCRKCSGEAGAAGDGEKCVPCGSGPHFNPRQFGLMHPRVLVTELQPHTNYTFNIEALNGVSDLSPSPRQPVSVNITTSQTGEMSHIYILCFSIKWFFCLLVASDFQSWCLKANSWLLFLEIRLIAD